MMALPPGEFLKDELEARGLTVQQFAALSEISIEVLEDILSAKQVLDADTAFKLGMALGTSDRLWINLQAQYASNKFNTPLEALQRFREAGIAMHLQDLVAELEQAKKEGKIK